MKDFLKSRVSVENILSLIEYFHLIGRSPLSSLVYWAKHIKEVLINLIGFPEAGKEFAFSLCSLIYIFLLPDLL